MGDVIYKIKICYLEHEKLIDNIDPDRYSYFDLIDDVYDHALNGIPSIEKQHLQFSCRIPSSDEWIVVDGDNTVLNMFDMYKPKDLIELRVEVMRQLQMKEGDDNDFQNSDNSNGEDGKGDNNASTENENDIDFLNSDDGNRESENANANSESENANADSEESEDEGDHESNESSDSGWIEEAHEGDESDYQSDDHCELVNSSDSEFEDAKNSWQLHYKSRQLSNQEKKLEFKVVLIDGKTFCIKTYTSKHTCVRVDSSKEATARWMGTKLVSILRENPGINNTGLQ
ncbi:hypothetical protein CDL12_20015 [Handroanthus impetiginosus]|uniref:Transposase MuDR plant domain-containing protein n=1 Tax=Handroanthus impetiginosus TaxID=429701 RepID=A0A2G9GQ95_9LAMI|nr:hypothetical protein CDL12_20015 [Handroanthus impetiginosus]